MPKRIRKLHTKLKVNEKVNPSPKKLKVENNSNLNSHPLKMHPEVEILNSPVKSANDKKNYKVIRLQNGLTACLIADPSSLENVADNFQESDSESDSDASGTSGSELDGTDSNAECGEDEIISDDERVGRMKKMPETEEKLAAASLCVGVGSFSDPAKIPGMAHFLEHMVFMGSTKYPQENDFDSFLKKRGGSDNASTDCETTTFYFECLEKDLSKALDKFAQFFISPLMKREAMTREREAIDSEFQMALPSDLYRKEQIFASLAANQTPVNKFVWGNLITLRDNVADDVLYQGVHEFRKRHYSAHRMTLAIQARLPLEVLESYVVNCFTNVPNNQLPGDDFTQFQDNVFNNFAFKRIYYIKPVKNICQIDLTWALPSMLHMYKSKPNQYVSWLLGHEGKGSLLSYLREKLWALSIFTGNTDSGLEDNSMFCLFSVSLILTPQGLKHINEIIDAVFSYISLLKEVGPQERIFNEIKTIEDTSFRFKEEETAVDFVENLSESMHYFPPEDYLTGSDLYFEYNPEAISMVVNKLNPNNLNILISSSDVPDDIVFDKTEPWFSTSYTDREIPAEWIEKWSEIKPMECFSLPTDNNFLSTNFDILDLSQNIVPQYPSKIVDTELVELWYKPDNKFKLPQAFINYYFLNTLCLQSIENSCLLDLYINILSFQLTEELYSALVADLGYSISVGDYGVIVKVEGYNEKLPLLLDVIIKYVKNMSTNTNEDLFSAVKDKQSKCYYNSFLKPSRLARSVRLSMLMDPYWPALEKYHAIKKLSYLQFKDFCICFLAKLHIQGLMEGNITEDEALKINSDVIKIINCEALEFEAIPKIRVTQVPVGKHRCKVMSFNKDDTNSIITNYYQIGPGTLTSLVTVEILMLIIEEPLFDILRTKEQLGYHVYCTCCDTFGTLGYCITVNTQVTKCTTEFVDERICAFVLKMTKYIKQMSVKKLNQIKQDLIKVKQLVDIHLKDEVSRNWLEIVQQDFMFDRIPSEIDAIEKVKISDIKKILANVSLNESSCRKLSIQVAGYNKEKVEDDSVQKEADCNCVEDYQIKYCNNENNLSNYNFIDDITKFKKSLFLFPVHKIK